MTYEEAISELVVIKSVYSHMRGEYKPCVEALQMAIDLLRQADTPQTEEICERCIYVRGSQWCQGCNGTPKRWNGEKVVDTPQTETQIETQNSNLTFEKQTDEEYINNLPWTEKDCPWK